MLNSLHNSINTEQNRVFFLSKTEPGLRFTWNEIDQANRLDGTNTFKDIFWSSI